LSREGGARFGRAAANIDRLDSLGTATGGFRPGSILGLDTTNAASGTFSYANPIANPTDRSANGTSASVGRAVRIMRSSRRS